MYFSESMLDDLYESDSLPGSDNEDDPEWCAADESLETRFVGVLQGHVC